MKYVVLIALLFTIGCTPNPIPITLDEVDPMPVVWSQAIPNSTTLIYMGRTFSALSYQEGDSTNTDSLLQQLLVPQAIVTLSNGLETDTLFKITDGLFATLTMELIPGNTYYLQALDLTHNQSVSSAAMMMPVVAIDSVNWNAIDTSTYEIEVRFTDPPGSNWYALHFYSTFEDPLEVQDPFAANNITETALLSDLELNSANALIVKELDFITSDTVFVSLNNISEEYYNYLSQRQRGGTIYNQLVQEPINYITNINGGYGFFSLHTPSVRQVIFTE
jgi:hypothetical protein